MTRKSRLLYTLIAIAALIVAATLVFTAAGSAQAPTTPSKKAVKVSNDGGGHLYMQTNETRNTIIHYRWSPNGTITEMERVLTGRAYLYQIYGNASKLVGYATQPDGSLKEVTSVRIPYNSPQGLAGF